MKTFGSIWFAFIVSLCVKGQEAEPEIVEYSARTSIPRRNLKLEPSGTIYYVSVLGNDQNPGTKEKPFKTIQKSADIMLPGDICFVREGVYRETVGPKNGGMQGDPIRYVAYPGEEVVLNGTDELQLKWTKHHGNIYKTEVDKAFDQLFVDGEMMIEARWPNMPFEDLWERSAWATSDDGSGYEKMVDAELAKTNIDWTGAIATLNVAHQFHTWTRKVSKHKKGSDTFEYVGNMGKLSGTIGKPGHWSDDFYYLTGKLGALDIPTEWFHDKTDNLLYIWTPDGKSPAKHKIEVKARDHGFYIKDINEIHLIGFDFFASTFEFENTFHSLVDDCHLVYPTFARELNDGGASIVTGMTGSYNTIRNSTIAFTPLSGLAMDGPYNTLSNNLIHDVCWNGSLRYPAIRMSARENPGNEDSPSIVKGNTVYNIGSAGIGFRNQAYHIEYNYVHHAGLLSHDVSAIYTSSPKTAGTTVSYNWVHNCHPEIDNGKNIGLGIRADDQCRRMSVHHNVVWDVGLDAIIMKGDYHKVYNNTVFHTEPKYKFGNAIRMDTEPEPYKAWRIDAPLFSDQNMHSLVFNNAVGFIRAYHKAYIPLVHGSNVIHNALEYDLPLVNKSLLDFRPKEGSALIDAGIAMPGITDHFLGAAPDVGAYEAGGVFWKPGYQKQKALFYKNNEEYDKLTD